MKKLFLTAVVAVFVGASAFAQSENKGIVTEKFWARATIGNAPTGVVYGKITNFSGKDDAIVSVSTPVARNSQIHRTVMNAEGVMTMQHMEKIVLKNGTYVIMEPGDIHLMLMGLNQRLETGYEIPLRLEFENSPAQTVRVKIYPTGTKWQDVQ